jgi:hypothetical protein
MQSDGIPGRKTGIAAAQEQLIYVTKLVSLKIFNYHILRTIKATCNTDGLLFC